MTSNNQKYFLLFVIFLYILLFPAASFVIAQNRIKPQLFLSSNNVINGNVLMVTMDTHEKEYPMETIQLRFEQKNIPIYKHPLTEKNILFSILSIPYHTQFGPSYVKLEWTDPLGRHIRSLPIMIVQGKYKSENIKRVRSRMINPRPEDILRAQKESIEIKKAYSKISDKILWHKPFQMPVNDVITSPYGTKRLINGKLKRYHSGVDLRAKTGTPVYATNSGIVRFSENTFFNGNLIIIDHGLHIFSNYAHLSQLNVVVNQLIKKGEMIGLAGATGRVNGPHLHWGIKINGINVDPIQFLNTINKPIQSEN